MKATLGLVLSAVGFCDSAPLADSKPASLTAAFVGNSYIFYSDLPGMLTNIAEAEGAEFSFGSNTPGGSALWQHADLEIYGEETNSLLFRESWDFVVLQDQSQTPGGGRVSSGAALPIGEGKVRSLAAIEEWFAPRMRFSKPVLYSTWGRRDGDAANPELFSTFNEMNRRTTQGYIEYASRLDEAMVVPAGRAFELIWEDSQGEEPPVTHADLYWSQADDSHPSLRGTYLIACLFYGKLWGRSPEGLAWSPLLIPAAEVNYLQSVAARTLQEQRAEA